MWSLYTLAALSCYLISSLHIFSRGPAGGNLLPIMPKRKVTFQGVGDEDDEDEISVPKKKVRWPDF